jgi:hypothetical protein
MVEVAQPLHLDERRARGAAGLGCNQHGKISSDKGTRMRFIPLLESGEALSIQKHTFRNKGA